MVEKGNPHGKKAYGFYPIHWFTLVEKTIWFLPGKGKSHGLSVDNHPNPQSQNLSRRAVQFQLVSCFLLAHFFYITIVFFGVYPKKNMALVHHLPMKLQ